jgi:hypothetical protein
VLRGLHGASLCVGTHHQHRVPIEPEVYGGQRRERPDEQAGGYDEHEGERDLANEQEMRDGVSPVTGERVALLLEHVARRGTTGAQGGCDAEEQRRADRHRRREANHAPVE